MSTPMSEVKAVEAKLIVQKSSSFDKVMKVVQTLLVLGILIVQAVLSVQLHNLTSSLTSSLNTSGGNSLPVAVTNLPRNVFSDDSPAIAVTNGDSEFLVRST
jgi:hypothetical protein